MARNVRATARQPVTIELSALFGRFRVPGRDFTVRFASTFASPDVPGHHDLLDELKPMRERVDASNIFDLTALLQRDLNDRRVARDLIPYLIGPRTGAMGRIGFFPAILAVLVPRGYLAQRPDQDDQVAYPAADEDPDAQEVSYTRAGRRHYAWKVERYAAEDDDSLQPVGLLHINPRETDVVVLDGQHRANAFRYLAGAFDPSEQIYGDFYRDIARPEDFAADLPVTIIWFEALNQTEVRPGLISRQLFVDVNNTATAVSTARTILLDDRSVSSVATQAFYNRAAEANFAASSFSLLHSAFDMDSDLATVQLPALALTSPEIAEAAFFWALLGSGRYDLAYWQVDRVRAQRNRARFVRQLGTADNVSFGTDEDENVVQLTGPEFAEEYRDLMSERTAPALWNLMSGLTLLNAHYRAAEHTEEWVRTLEGGHYERAAWSKIFKGGEGLYWTFRDHRVPEENAYRVAAARIESYFRQQRAQELGVEVAEADAAYKSFATKAFQIGFVMSADFLAERGVGGGRLADASEELVTGLGRYTPGNWLAFFRDLRPLLIRGDTAPKLWPTYRNLLVRMYDQGREAPLNDQTAHAPEQRAFELAIDAVARRRAEDTSELPEDAELRRLLAAERLRISEVFQRVGLTSTWFGEDWVLERGLERFQSEFERLVRPRDRA